MNYEINFIYNNEKDLENRKSIFLDTNIWIDLVEKDNELIKTVRSKLIHLTEIGKIFCPLSLPLYTEFHRQAFDSIQRISPLIDSLSLNYYLKDREKLFEIEILNYVYKLPHSPLKNDIFVPFMCSNNNKQMIELPRALNVKHPEVKKLFKSIHDRLINKKFSEYITQMKNKIPHFDEDDSYNLYADIWKIRHEITGGNKKKMYEFEQEGIVEKIITPLIFSIIRKEEINLPDNFLLNMKGNDPELTEKFCIYAKEVIKNCKTIRNTLEIITFAGFDIGRKGRKTDHEDLEIMILVSSYCDALLTSDTWMHEMLTKNKSKLFSNTEFFIDYTKFDSYLDSILCS